MNIQTTQQAGAAGSGASGGSSSKASQMGKDDFVKLLMAQIGNQDPLSPMDNQAFVAQLAQFSNLELLQGADSRLESLLLAQASSNQISAASLVGKDALYQASAVTLESGKDATIRANLSNAASEVTVVLTDGAGNTVRTLKLGAQGMGAMEAQWDGRDDRGNTVPPGDYKVQITAADSSGKSVEVQQQTYGRIIGVSFQNGFPELMLGTVRIKLSDVVAINEAK